MKDVLGRSLVVCVGWTVACGEPPPVLPDPPAPASYWVERSDAALDAEIRSTCDAAVSDHAPMLMVFSAPWCIDCRQVRAMEQQPLLAEELTHWKKLVVHVGKFDRHEALRNTFNVGAIAHWVALRPEDCGAPIETWPVLRSGTFEPRTGFFGPKTEAELVEWLVETRSK